jgi:hypothetical protein
MQLMHTKILTSYARWYLAHAGKDLRVRQSGADFKPPQAAVVKGHGGERCGKGGI